MNPKLKSEFKPYFTDEEFEKILDYKELYRLLPGKKVPIVETKSKFEPGKPFKIKKEERENLIVFKLTQD